MIRRIRSAAPIRVCDNGGWTDTWFAGHGAVFNIAVTPLTEVQVDVFPRGDRPRCELFAENYGVRYEVDLDQKAFSRHPLLEAAIHCMGVPEDLSVQVSIFSEAPAGASTGTSASVAVAMVGALDALTPGRLTPKEVADTAWRIETEMLGQQSGIQDQLASAFGGINYIEMSSFPQSVVHPIEIPDPLWWELERRLVLVFLGKSHQSSETHKEVIQRLELEGEGSSGLATLRSMASRSRDAVLRGDWEDLGATMSACTEAQRELHPGLIAPDADAIWEIASSHGALGMKVNGAGGDGGSVTLLMGPNASATRTMVREFSQTNPAWQEIPTLLSRRGLRVWEA